MMKKNILFVLLVSIHFINVFAGFINGTLQYKGDTRRYKIYIPDIYSSQNIKVPLVLGLHGYGDNIDNFGNICLNNIADTANYICVYAEALPWMGANAWNSGAGVGAIKVNKDEDDVGFLNGILDTIIANYKIDTTRIYVFGFSFGGFMTDRLATECTNRFAAACNISGLHGNFLKNKKPKDAIPYLKFHGTNDLTINYDGSKTAKLFRGFGLSAENTVQYWITNNNCNTTPIIDTLPDVAADGLQFIRYSYLQGVNDSKVLFYKVMNGEHRWYGLPTNDISYCQTIWDFFKQFYRKLPDAISIEK